MTQISSCSVLVSAAAVGRAVRSGAPEKLHFLAHGGRRLVGALSPDSRPPHSTTLSKGATSQPKPPDHFHSGAVILIFSQVSLGPSRAEIGQCQPFKDRLLSTHPSPSLVPLPSNSLALLSSVWRQCKRQQIGGCTVTDWRMAACHYHEISADANSFLQSSEALFTEVSANCVLSMNHFQVVYQAIRWCELPGKVPLMATLPSGPIPLP